jgi:hypothetical protein
MFSVLFFPCIHCARCDFESHCASSLLAEKVIQRTSIRNTGFAHISINVRKSSTAAAVALALGEIGPRVTRLTPAPHCFCSNEIAGTATCQAGDRNHQ